MNLHDERAQDTSQRTAQLHAIGRAYVEVGLAKKNFDAIPYHEDVVLRAPILPGGSEKAIQCRERIRETWWAPLPGLLADVHVLDTYVNKALSAVTVEFHCGITNPTCTLRIIDRFTVNDRGEIIEQENFFDPRGLMRSD